MYKYVHNARKMDSIWRASKPYFMPLKFRFYFCQTCCIEDNIFEAQKGVVSGLDLAVSSPPLTTVTLWLYWENIYSAIKLHHSCKFKASLPLFFPFPRLSKFSLYKPFYKLIFFNAEEKVRLAYMRIYKCYRGHHSCH